MVQSDVVAVPVVDGTNEDEVEEEGGNEESSTNNGLLPVRQRGGLGRSLHSNAVP